jgi:hypothetical protein
VLTRQPRPLFGPANRGFPGREQSQQASGAGRHQRGPRSEVTLQVVTATVPENGIPDSFRSSRAAWLRKAQVDSTAMESWDHRAMPTRSMQDLLVISTSTCSVRPHAPQPHDRLCVMEWHTSFPAWLIRSESLDYTPKRSHQECGQNRCRIEPDATHLRSDLPANPRRRAAGFDHRPERRSTDPGAREGLYLLFSSPGAARAMRTSAGA